MDFHLVATRGCHHGVVVIVRLGRLIPIAIKLAGPIHYIFVGRIVQCDLWPSNIGGCVTGILEQPGDRTGWCGAQFKVDRLGGIGGNGNRRCCLPCQHITVKL